MISSKLMKSPYGEGLSVSQVWCDVLNFLVGILCIINGFRGWEYITLGEHSIYPKPHPHKEMVIFTGLDYCVVTFISLLGFCLGKKFGFGKIHFWSRVWMLPVLTPLFIMTFVNNFVYSHNEGPCLSATQFFLPMLGYIWFLQALLVLLCKRLSCSCGKKTQIYQVENSANVQNRRRPGRVENIYENNPASNTRIPSTII